MAHAGASTHATARGEQRSGATIETGVSIMAKQDARPRTQESGGTHFSRRTLTRGVAWSVPVVATVAHAPAFAVSRVRPRAVFVGACKFPGNSCKKANKGYAFAFQVTNDDVRSLAFCSASLTIDEPDPFDGITFNYTGGCFTVGGGQSGIAYFFFSGSADSANSPFTGSLTIRYANDCGSCGTDYLDLDPIPIVVTGTPPGGLCQCDATFIPN